MPSVAAPHPGPLPASGARSATAPLANPRRTLTPVANSGKRNGMQLGEQHGEHSGQGHAGGIARPVASKREIAIVDAREEGSFHERHLLMASCLRSPGWS